MTEREEQELVDLVEKKLGEDGVIESLRDLRERVLRLEPAPPPVTLASILAQLDEQIRK